MMTVQQDKLVPIVEQHAIQQEILAENNRLPRESQLREETAPTVVGRCKKFLAALKNLKEAVATLTWLITTAVSLLGVMVVYHPISSRIKLLPELFPQSADGGTQFSWSYPDNLVRASFDGECAKPGFANLFGFLNAGSGLRLQYGAVSNMRDGGWGVHWENAPARAFDASRFAYLRFWVRGASGDESFQIGLKDTGGNETKIESKDWVVADARRWIEATIPLSEFESVNRQSLNNVSFSFNARHGSGSLCIGGMAFEERDSRV